MTWEELKIKKLAYESYLKGKVDCLHCVLSGLRVFVGNKIEPPLTIEDIIKLIGTWLKDAEQDLKREAEND